MRAVVLKENKSLDFEPILEKPIQSMRGKLGGR
jgi:hypothetical protein